MKARKNSFILPPKTAPMTIRRALRACFDDMKGSLSTRRLNIRDSFDWRLIMDRLLFVTEDQSFRLIELPADRVTATGKWSPCLRPVFWWQIPDADAKIRQILRQHLDVRALMSRLVLRQTDMTLRILNAAQQTVAWVVIETFRLENAPPKTLPLLRTCKVKPVRGHAPVRRQIASVLTELGASPAQQHPIVAALQQAGLEPGKYSTKIRVDLVPSMPAVDAANMIFRHLLSIMRSNEQGIRQDIDSEFLHDFRVAVRRARSLLTLLKPEMDRRISATLKKGLRRMAKATNVLRDFDVYLLQQDSFKNLLPEALQPGILPLFEHLERQRRREKKRVDRFMASDRYGRIMDEMLRYAEQPADMNPSAGQAATTIADVAGREIDRCFSDVIRAGTLDGEKPNDQQLHQLRLECKRLRYALEFFRSLFAPEPVSLLIGQVKALQDYLGRYNDLVVQLQFLFDFLDKKPASKKTASANLATAVGALIGNLSKEKEQLHQSFAEVFGRFNTPENTAIHLKKRILVEDRGGGN